MLCTLIIIGAIMLSKNIQVGLNMHLYDDIGDASSYVRGSTSSLINESVMNSTLLFAVFCTLNLIIESVTNDILLFNESVIHDILLFAVFALLI